MLYNNKLRITYIIIITDFGNNNILKTMFNKLQLETMFNKLQLIVLLAALMIYYTTCIAILCLTS